MAERGMSLLQREVLLALRERAPADGEFVEAEVVARGLRWPLESEAPSPAVVGRALGQLHQRELADRDDSLGYMARWRARRA
jgi:hypothetical protein